jgi:hypothetical protein
VRKTAPLKARLGPRAGDNKTESPAASSARDADCQCTGAHFRAQDAAIAYDVTIELIRVGVTQTYFDLSGAPLVDAIIGTRPPGDQSEERA